MGHPVSFNWYEYAPNMGPRPLEPNRGSRIATERGHQVTLFEKHSELGGAMLYVCLVPGKEKMRWYLDWIRDQLLDLEVDIRLSHAPTVQELRDFDIVLNATGALSYVPEVAAAGVKFYLFQRGFMHQKVLLIDEWVSTIGTANFDNRSFRLNFEISVLAIDLEFAREVEAMLTTDLSNSRELTADEVLAASRSQQIAMRVARLFSPVL